MGNFLLLIETWMITKTHIFINTQMFIQGLAMSGTMSSYIFVLGTVDDCTSHCIFQLSITIPIA